MRTPLQISYQVLGRNKKFDRMIRGEVNKLQQLYGEFLKCIVLIEKKEITPTTDCGYTVRIEMGVPPGHLLIVGGGSTNEPPPRSLPEALENTFAEARRRLHLLMQHIEQETNAIVWSVNIDEGYGILRRLDGEEIFFHNNCVVNDDFRYLRPGIGVNCTTVPDNKGLQAFSVLVTDKSCLATE